MKKELSVFLSLSYLLPAGPMPALLAPTPAFANDPPPPPINTAPATAQGEADGNDDGVREGQVRGRADGEASGEKAGSSDGHHRCEANERKRQFDIGFSEGHHAGTLVGAPEGEHQGRIDGNNSGEKEGRADGEYRADRDSQAAAAAPGAEQGTQEANASDATVRGDRDGLVAGDLAAAKQARDVDYPLGRQQYHDLRYAEPVDSKDSFSLRPTVAGFSSLGSTVSAIPASSRAIALPSATAFSGAAAPRFFGSPSGFEVGNALLGQNPFSPPNAPNASPDNRFRNLRHTYPSAVENTAYQQAYARSYDQGFRHAFALAWQSAFAAIYPRSADSGCRAALAQGYGSYREQGYKSGYDRGYSEAYDPAYAAARRSAYDYAFNAATERAYTSNYQADYKRHFEESRASAYARRVSELYNAAFGLAKQKKFDQVYPGYAEQQNKLGKADEAADFAARPARLLDASILETIPNGAYEPGETLRLKVNLRNFASQVLAGRDVKLVLEALDATSAIVTQSQAVLPKDLKAKSVTEVRDALEFKMNESAINRVSQFRLSVFHRGTLAGSQMLEVKTLYLIGTELAETPTLVPDLAMPVRLKVTNQSQIPTDPALKIKFQSSFKLDNLMPEMTLASLQPGESRVLEFPVKLRTTVLSHLFPLYFQAFLPDGRKVGDFASNSEYPIVNEYRLAIPQDLSALRKSGLIRVPLQIQNLSTSDGRQLELTARFKDRNSKQFSVQGRNPQALSGLVPGQKIAIEVPVQVKRDNDGGTLEIEIKDNGKTVVKQSQSF